MIKKQSLCERVLEWSIENRNLPMPDSLQEHCSQCTDCRAFLEQEIWITETVRNQAKLAPTNLSADKFARVFQAIQETSERLSEPAKSSFQWRWVIASVSVACMAFLIGFLFLPLFHGENYLANKINTNFRTMLQYAAPVVETAAVKTAEKDLRFASAFITSEAEKTFYYFNDHYSYEELLWIKWLVDRTGADYKKIDRDYQYLSPSQLLKKWHIPAKEAKKALQAILDKHHQEIESADLTIDGVVQKVDYNTLQIWVDSIDSPLQGDEVSINFANANSLVELSLNKHDDVWMVVDIKQNKSDSPVLEGTLVSIEANRLILRDPPAETLWNTRTFFNDASPDELLNQSIRVRTLLSENKMLALTVTKQGNAIQRTLTGLIDKAFQNGFTLKGLQQNFMLCSTELQNPKMIGEKIQVSVTGEDYGSYFLVKELVQIKPPEDNKLFAVATPKTQTSSPKKSTSLTKTPATVKMTASTDWIVGVKNNQYLLASGSTISKGSNTIPIGSRIVTQSSPKTVATIQSHLINELAIHHYTAGLTNKLVNGVLVFQNEQKKKILYFTDKNILMMNQTYQIQGRCIEYPELIIMIEGRVFQTPLLKTLTGLVVREMEHAKVYLLEDGTIFQIDALSVIQNGPISVGKTVKITGLWEYNTFKAYIIDVQREFAIFTGKITEINRAEKWCKIDSGKQFFWTSETQLSQILQAMESGKIIYCKAYYENQQWLIEKITFSKGESGDQA